MKVRTTKGWIGEVKGAVVTQVDVAEGESLLVEPGKDTRAVVLLVEVDQ